MRFLRRRLLPLLFAVIPECPQRLDDGSERSSDEVIDLLYTQTVSCGLHMGVDDVAPYQLGSPSEVVSLRLRVEREKLLLGLTFVRDLLRRSRLDPARVALVGRRLLKLLEERVHDSSNVMFILLRRQMLAPKSLKNCFDHFGMRKLLEEALQDPEALAQELSTLRDVLCEPKNMQ